MEYFLCVLGMVMVVEGLPYFGFPDKMKAFLQVVLEQDDATLRIVGAILVALGVLIVFVSRKGLACL
jgi:uncharacterized protein